MFETLNKNPLVHAYFKSPEGVRELVSMRNFLTHAMCETPWPSKDSKGGSSKENIEESDGDKPKNPHIDSEQNIYWDANKENGANGI